MVLPWNFHGAPTRMPPWCFHGGVCASIASTMLPSMVLPLCCHAPSMVLPWCLDGACIGLLLVLSLFSHCIVIILPVFRGVLHDPLFHGMTDHVSTTWTHEENAHSEKKMCVFKPMKYFFMRCPTWPDERAKSERDREMPRACGQLSSWI